MRRSFRKCLIIGVPSLMVAIFAAFWLRQPRFEGRLLASIFRDLYLGTYADHDVNNWIRASAAFSRMDSNAVPFLVVQLTNSVPTVGDKLFASAQLVPILSKHVRDVPLSQKRAYAAVALRLMGTNAAHSAPVLIPIWMRNPTNSPGILTALGSVLGHPPADGYTQAEFKEYEVTVMNSARERYPSLFLSSSFSEPRPTNGTRKE